MREVNISLIRSVDRAIDLLDCFTADQSSLTIDEIIKKTSLAKATAYRLLYTLEKRGLIKYNQATFRYSLGLKVLEYAGFLQQELDVRNVANDLLIELQESIHQTVMMVIPEDDTMVYVFSRENPNGLKFSSFLGQRRPMNYGVVGKIFMAYAREEQRERLLNLEMPKHTENTVTDRETIIKQLESIQDEGLFVEMEETNIGVNALSAPVFNSQGECIAAIGIVGPSVQLVNDELEKCKSALKEIANQISERMGYRKFK
ncbi:MAG TPA: IclR family transcriptional regulator [Ureibacillus sp.]|nr:IclR family transcriptional regulator [Ureibacillus sp.]